MSKNNKEMEKKESTGQGPGYCAGDGASGFSKIGVFETTDAACCAGETHRSDTPAHPPLKIKARALRKKFRPAEELDPGT